MAQSEVSRAWGMVLGGVETIKSSTGHQLSTVLAAVQRAHTRVEPHPGRRPIEKSSTVRLFIVRDACVDDSMCVRMYMYGCTQCCHKY